MSLTASKPRPAGSCARIQLGWRPAGAASKPRGFWPSLMAVKPCGVRYFSPLRGGVSVTIGMFLSVDMRRKGRILLLLGGRRRWAAKSRQRLGFAVDLELALLEFN